MSMKNYILYIFAVFIVLFPYKAVCQDSIDRRLDSLRQLYLQLDDLDTNKYNVMSLLARHHYIADSSMMWANRLIVLAQKRGNLYFEAKGYYLQSLAYYHLGDYIKSSESNFLSLSISDQIGCQYHVAYNNMQLGINNLRMFNYEQASQYFSEALDLFQLQGDSLNIANCYRNIANIYGRQKLYNESERYFKKSFAIDSLLGNRVQLSLDYQELGIMKLQRFFFVITKQDPIHAIQAEASLQKALDLGPGDLDARYWTLYNLCKSLHVQFMLYRNSPEKLKSLAGRVIQNTSELKVVADRLKLDKYQIGYNLALANLCSLTGRLDEAREALDRVMPYVSVDEVTGLDLSMDYYLCSDIYYRMMGDFKNAYEMKSKYYEAQNSQILLDYAVNSVTTIEQDKHEVIMHKKDLEQAKFRQIAIIVLVVLLLSAMFLVYNYNRKRRTNAILEEKNAELDAQASTLNEQNKVITASLNYASLIQRAVMPRQDKLIDMFGQYFVIFRPLHIVAGDFYWANTVGRFQIIVCADCTGHGVPGAFVSMLGISLLNEITSAVNDGVESAGHILDILRTKLMRSLGQNEKSYEPGKEQNKDGIDMSILMVDYQNMVVHYAGAFRPLWIIRDGNLIKYKANRQPIGMYFGEVVNFTDNVIDISSGDILYMFSDGITDQFGYVDDERKVAKQFSAKRLQELLLKVWNLPMSVQKSIIEETLDKWENGHRQIDDITIMGIKIQ